MKSEESLSKHYTEQNLKNDNVSLRKLCNTEDDYRLLEKWYKEEEIYSHFEQRILNYEEIVKKYYSRTLVDAKVPVFIIEYASKSVGIIQYQIISNDSKKLYNLDNNNSFEIDIFIGELNLHNKGIGSKSVRLMANYLFEEKDADLVVMCPLKENVTAKRCYKKVGFKINGEITTEDTIGNIQKYVVMVWENE